MTTTARDRGMHALAPVPLMSGAIAPGLATAVAFRVLIILQHAAPHRMRPGWYFAVPGTWCSFTIGTASTKSGSAPWRSMG